MKKYKIYFCEYATYKPFCDTHIAGRIELYDLNGDIEKDKLEIDNVKLPTEVWRGLRNKVEGMEFETN